MSGAGPDGQPPEPERDDPAGDRPVEPASAGRVTGDAASAPAAQPRDTRGGVTS